jgi:predicted nucleotidyltransferase
MTAMSGLNLVEPRRDALVALCQKYAVKRLRLFGSAAEGSFDPGSSDLDFLVEFNPPVGMNAFHQFIDLKLELEDLFGRHVDLVTWRAVKDPVFRQRAEETAIDLYAA